MIKLYHYDSTVGRFTSRLQRPSRPPGHGPPRGRAPRPSGIPPELNGPTCRPLPVDDQEARAGADHLGRNPTTGGIG